MAAVGAAAVLAVCETDVFVCQDGFAGVFMFSGFDVSDHFNGGIGFEPGDEIGARFTQFSPPVVVAIAFVKNIGGAFFRLHDVALVHIVNSGVGDAVGNGAAGGWIHQDMEF